MTIFGQQRTVPGQQCYPGIEIQSEESREAGLAPERPIASDRMELLRELHYIK